MKLSTAKGIRLVGSIFFVLAVVVFLLPRNGIAEEYFIMTYLITVVFMILAISFIVIGFVLIGALESQVPIVVWGLYERYFFATGSGLLVASLVAFVSNTQAVGLTTGIGGLILTSLGTYFFAKQERFKMDIQKVK